MAVSTLNHLHHLLNSTTAAITSTSPPANEHYDIDNDFDSPSKNRKLSNISASYYFYQDENHIKSNHARKSSNPIPYPPTDYRQIFLLLWLKQGKGQLQLKATYLVVLI